MSGHPFSNASSGGHAVLSSSRVSLAHDVRASAGRFLGTHLPLRGIDRVIRSLYSPDRRERTFLRGEIVAWDGTRYHIDTREFHEWYLWVYGQYERRALQRMHRCLREGDVVVDCGANIGSHTCSIARWIGPTGRVVAVEPVPSAAARLEQNCRLNGLENVVVVRGAVSDLQRTAELFVPEGDASRATLHPFWATAAAEASVVRTEPLDDLLARLDARRPRLIKLDIEGHELPALRGAARTLARERPLLFFEFSEAHAAAAGYSWSDLWDLVVAEHGYRLSPVAPPRDKVTDRSDHPAFSFIAAIPRELEQRQ